MIPLGRHCQIDSWVIAFSPSILRKFAGSGIGGPVCTVDVRFWLLADIATGAPARPRPEYPRQTPACSRTRASCLKHLSRRRSYAAPAPRNYSKFFRWSSGCRIYYWSSRDMGPAAFGGCRGVLVNPAHTTLPQHRHIYPTGRERFAARLTGSLRSVQVRCRSRRWRASGFCFGPHFFQSLLQVCRIHDRHEFDRHFGVSATCNQYTTRSAASYRVSFDSPTTRQIGSTNGAATTRARSPRACLPGGGARCREPCCVLRWCWRCFGGAERMLPLNRTA